MVTQKRHSHSPSDEGLRVVCPKLIARYPKNYTLSKAKITFSTKSDAKSGAKRNDSTKRQKPYLCRYCGFWHNGKTANVQNTEQEFIIPVKGELIILDLLDSDTPLAREIEKLEMVRYYPENSAQSDAIRSLIKNYSYRYTISDLMIFSVQSYAKAIVWALQNPPHQPVFLKIGDDITFSKQVGVYWAKQ